MKRHRTAVAIALLTLAVQQTAQSSQSRSAPVRTGSITGRVVVEQGSQLVPVRRARVTVSRGSQVQAVTATDLNGLYRFEDLADGPYRVSVIKSGFVPVGSRAETQNDPSVTVEVSAGVTPTADFRLQRAGALEGRFLDDSGRPLEHLLVNVEAIPSSAAQVGGKPWITTAFTDDLGRFRVHTLPPGRYVLHAPAPVSGNKLFYPSTENADDATVLTVGAGQTIDHLELTVATAEASRITAETMAAQEREVANGPVTPELSAQVSGRVLRSDNGLPVTGATIRLLSAQGALLRTTSTGPDGSYLFNRLRGDVFVLHVTAYRLIAADTSIGRPGTGTRIALKDAERMTQDLRLTPTAAIEGRMLDEFGDPVPGIRPVLTSRFETVRSSRPEGFEFKSTGLTDDRGWFRVYGLPPGDYFLYSLPEPFASAGAAPFASTYYPGTSSADSAIAIHVDGLDVYDANIKLVAAVTSTITGVLIDIEGRPVSNASVSLHATRQSDPFPTALAKSVSGVNGQFAYRDVQEGSYVLQATTKGMFGTTPITVVASTDVERRPISLTLRPYTTARGRVVFDSVSASQPSNPAGTVVGITGSQTERGMGDGGFAGVDAAGNFTISNLAMHGVVRVFRPTGWVIARVTHEGRDITDTVFDFQSGDVNGLEVVLTNRLGHLSGTVTGDVSAQPTVFVVGADSDSAPYLTRTTHSARPDRDGSFQIQGLLPGRYYVLAVPQTYPRSQDSTWLLGLRSSASLVVVTEGQTTSVKIAVGK